MTRTEAFRILGLNENATADAVSRAYRKRVFETHPDRGGTAVEFLKVQAAYEVLEAFRDADCSAEGKSVSDQNLVIPYVQCVNCSQPILLPPPNLENKTIARPPQPKAGWKIRLACSECGLASVYSEQDVLFRLAQQQDLDIFRQTSLVRFESECEERCTGVRIVWHTRVDFSEDFSGLDEVRKKQASSRE
jgi:hypothetical protein